MPLPTAEHLRKRGNAMWTLGMPLPAADYLRKCRPQKAGPCLCTTPAHAGGTARIRRNVYDCLHDFITTLPQKGRPALTERHACLLRTLRHCTTALHPLDGQCDAASTDLSILETSSSVSMFRLSGSAPPPSSDAGCRWPCAGCTTGSWS